MIERPVLDGPVRTGPRTGPPLTISLHAQQDSARPQRILGPAQSGPAAVRLAADLERDQKVPGPRRGRQLELALPLVAQVFRETARPVEVLTGTDRHPGSIVFPLMNEHWRP